LELLQQLTYQLFHLVVVHGYWIVGLVIALESLGLPLPGEATLIAACAYAGGTQRLAVVPILLAAMLGAVIGDNIGYWIGREAGFRMLTRYGGRIGLSPARLRLGQFLFLKHGGKIVFFGRFVAILRTLAGLLAGANQMPWWRFFLFNIAGAIIWVGGYGTAAYLVGGQMEHLLGPIGITTAILAVLALTYGYLKLRQGEAVLQEAADAHFRQSANNPQGRRR
jgi:membrane protein DedA with SNARE-associated domain